MNKAFKEKMEEKCALKEQIRKLQYFLLWLPKPTLSFTANYLICLHGPYMPPWSIVWKQTSTFTLTLQSS